MAIPSKRYEQNGVSYLTLDEVKALIAAPDGSTWLGRRDHALILLAVLTGVRVTELVTLRVGDLSLSAGAHIKVTGKGRKRRAVTLTPETVAVLRQWLKERQGHPEDPLFPTRRGTRLSRDTVELLVAKHAAAAADEYPSLADKRVTPHTLRHYVDAWVMWPAWVFPLLAGVVRAGSGHITRDCVGQRSGSSDWLSVRPIRSVLSIQ